jgi:hypothetical protein
MSSFFNLLLDTLAPDNLVAKLNNGALYTSSTSVTLGVTVDDADTTGYQMKIWGVDGVAAETDASWETFAASKAITLPTGDGLKTVNVKVRDDVGNETAAATLTITLVSDVPVVTVTGPDKSKISKVAGFDAAVISFMANVAFVEYKVCVVPAENSLVDAGTLIPVAGGSINTSGTADEGNEFAADTAINVTINGTDLESASGGDGTKIVKVFVKDERDIWSVA